MIESDPTKKPNRLVSFLLNNSNRSKPALMMVVVVFFAGIGTWALFGARAANNSMSLVPGSSNLSIGASLTVTIHENSGTDAVNAVEADITYDQTKLQFVSASTTSSPFDNGLNPDSNTPGSVKFSRAKNNTSVTGDQIVGSVTFTAISAGTTSISFANTSALILASNSTNVLSITSSGTYVIADTTAPNTPTVPAVGTRTVTSVAFSWTAPTDNVGVTGYKVYRNGTLINGNVSTTNFTDSGLAPNTNYTYTVAAFDAVNNLSAQSSGLVTSTLPDTSAPGVPTLLTVGTRTVNSIAFTWTASTDNVAVTGYNVLRNGVKVGISTATSYTDTGLTPNTNYSYTVSAYDAVPNTSSVSSALATSTLADTSAPSVPTGLTSPSQTTNSISLSWTASTDNVGVLGYNIFRNGVKVGNSTTSSYTDVGLTQTTSYSYTISAYDSVLNTSTASGASSFATKAKQGDVNSDGAVNIFDLSIMAAHWGQSGQPYSAGDLSGDGTVNIFDLSILASKWGT